MLMTTSTRAERAGSVGVGGRRSEAGALAKSVPGPVEDRPGRCGGGPHQPRHLFNGQPFPFLEQHGTAIVVGEPGEDFEDLHAGPEIPGQVLRIGAATIEAAVHHRVEVGVDSPVPVASYQVPRFRRSSPMQPETHGLHSPERGDGRDGVGQGARAAVRARLGSLEQMPGKTLQLEAILLDMIVDRLESLGAIAERGMAHLSMSIPNGAR